MPAWSDYKAEAKSRGALAWEVYVAQSTPVGGPEAVKAALPDHLAYIRSLESAGQLVFAGPISDPTGAFMQGAGMLVLRAASLDEARKLADNDPMHLTGARSFTLVRWLINEGALQVNVGLSTQTVDLL